ncbi:uncharacterized protein I206_103758 [Kwoniella pini CBS 10737]|uniref:Uncharacterized protein n=1 Tax=Kwoniella pini CBS 10737 TaxID=1296096 RepID=A0A1B9HSH6_9TREE|nr:uncharacterized protein I206_07707 [Kwoniella pini CBS 10737]OCF46230.1 hypothetical protein I206_07707 [Kwoniella pini CBS 10737]
MAFHGEGIGGVVFLILYLINFCILTFGFSTRRISFRSVYSFLLFHVCLRLSAQSVSIVTGTKDHLDTGLLIAFFVLGAEGYFSLVLCAYRFLIHHHQHVYPVSGSWLEGKPNKDKHTGKKDPWYVRLKRAMTARNGDGTKDPWVMTIIHWTLIGANTIIIIGGTRATGVDYTKPDFWKRIHDGQVLRAVGQAIFLAINVLLAVFLFLSVSQDRNPNGTLPAGWNYFFRVKGIHGAIDAADRPFIRSISPDLLVLVIAWPPLIVRGIFGLLQALVNPINYASPAAYGSITGFTKLFIALENVFSVLPEWTACCLLCTTMFFKVDHMHRSEKLNSIMGESGTPLKARSHAAGQSEGRKVGSDDMRQV